MNHVVNFGQPNLMMSKVNLYLKQENDSWNKVDRYKYGHLINKFREFRYNVDKFILKIRNFVVPLRPKQNTQNVNQK